MAKTMALINENNTIINLLWCSDDELETDTLINSQDIPVAIGDTYENGSFYRNGKEVLTPLQAAMKKLAEYNSLIASLSEVYENADT